MNIKNIPIILASASPRRRELMEQAGFTFTVQGSSAEEISSKEAPNELSERQMMSIKTSKKITKERNSL